MVTKTYSKKGKVSKIKKEDKTVFNKRLDNRFEAVDADGMRQSMDRRYSNNYSKPSKNDDQDGPDYGTYNPMML